jgi:hypothetical protein
VLSLLVAPQNQREDEDGAEHASRSSGLLCLQVSRARVSQSGLKTGGDMAWVVHVSSSRRLHESEAKDGWFDGIGRDMMEIGPKYPSLAVISFSTCMGILVNWLVL